MTPTEDTISTLNNLIETCKDGEKGFQRASDDVRAPDLKILLQRCSAQRAAFAQELQQQVQALGGDAETSGSASGALHRGWIDVKSAVTGRDEHAVLEECERGEDAAKKAYETALEGTTIPGTLLPMIQRQYADVVDVHDRVKVLRDQVLHPISSR